MRAFIRYTIFIRTRPRRPGRRTLNADELNLPNFSYISMTETAIKRVCQKALHYPRVYREEKAVEICEDEGIMIDYQPFKSLTGVLVREKNGAILGVREDLPETQTIRVILHELGHFNLHNSNRFSHIFHGHKHKVTGEEKEADLFAFCLSSDHIRESVRWNFIDYGKG